MIRNAVRAATVLLAALALPVVVLAAPPPANAVSGLYYCETYAPHCVGAPNLALYSPVEETADGRLIIASQLVGSFEGYSIFELVFQADQSKCVAVANNNIDAEIRPCSGGHAVVWALRTSNGHTMWINRAASQATNQDEYLTGLNNGGQMGALPLGFKGGYQRFN